MRSNAPSFIEKQRRAQILEAAVELLAVGGPTAASLSAIAERIGASKGVVSYHFEGKDELLRSVVTSVLSDAGAYMTPRIAAAHDARARLREYVAANLDYLAANRVRMRALRAVLIAMPSDSLYAEPGRDAVRALAGLIEDGQRAGQFRAADPVVAARSLRASIDSVGELLHDDPGLDVVAYARELLRLFETGLDS